MNEQIAGIPTPITEPAAVTTGKPSPGSMVREAREHAGLSQEALAAQTKLARQTVDALERDDFANLLEPVYVRGYYRKCAKVLGMPEQSLIDAYERLASPAAPSLPNKVRLATGDNLESGRRLPLRFSVVAPLLAIIVCAAIFWFLRGESQKQALTVTTPVPVPAEQPPVADDRLSHIQPAGSESQTAPMPSDTPAAPQGEAPAAAEPAPAATVPAAADGAVPAQATAAGSNKLLLSFGTASWVRVEDRWGKLLLSGLMNAGTQQLIDGRPPYLISLGNAPGVKVEYQGSAIDTAPYVKGNATAKFSVPVSAQPQP